jgi:hypothetical protein
VVNQVLDEIGLQIGQQVRHTINMRIPSIYGPHVLLYHPGLRVELIRIHRV